MTTADTETESHPLQPVWGLKHVAPADALAVWGARGIVEQTGFSLLPDRQEFVGTFEHRKLLKSYLDDGVLSQAQDQARKLQASGELWKHPAHPVDWSAEVSDRPDRGGRVVLYDSPEVCLMANTNGSYGYLYVTAWLKRCSLCPTT